MPAATQKASQLAKLRDPFPVEQVKQRPGGGGRMLDYIPIETVLERLLVVAPDYSWEAHLSLYENGMAIVEGHLTIDGKRAFGIGSMKNSDVDMAVKSANSEAIKNAAKNGFGVALELWDADHRELLDQQRQEAQVVSSDNDLLTALKNRVADIAVAAGTERTGPAIAAHFGIEVEKLQDRETLEQIVASAETAVASI